eukprot:Nitzschia sp. Nitz4//scaffold160_size51814//27176//27454//NITZ4_006911-RA/size51814-exonerate_est2genome-gene-0.1-mRNA-1//1//CDS//3329537848//2551//frame0
MSGAFTLRSSSSTITSSSSSDSESSLSASAVHYPLLFHPLGVLLLEYYGSLVVDDDEQTLAWLSTLQDNVKGTLLHFVESDQEELALTELFQV